MAGRDLRNQSLSLQAAQLKRTLESRDKRRQEDREARSARQLRDEGPYAASQQGKRATGGQNHSVAALSALSAADASAGPSYHCDLCKASFMMEVQYSQHMASAVHKKALERAKAEQIKRQRLEQSGVAHLADMAMGAASWGSHHNAGQVRAPNLKPATGGGAVKQSHMSLQNRQGQAAGFKSGQQGPGGAGAGAGAGAAPAAATPWDLMTHDQVLNAARADDGPLSIDGWVPPLVTAPVQPSAAAVGMHQQQQQQQLQQHESGAARVEGEDSDEENLQQGHQGRQIAVDMTSAGIRGTSSSSSSESGAETAAGALGLTGYGVSSDESDSSADSAGSAGAKGGVQPRSFF